MRVDVKLNKAVWSQGVKNVPKRLRIVVQRKRNEDDEDSVSGRRLGAAASSAARRALLVALPAPPLWLWGSAAWDVPGVCAVGACLVQQRRCRRHVAGSTASFQGKRLAAWQRERSRRWQSRGAARAAAGSRRHGAATGREGKRAQGSSLLLLPRLPTRTRSPPLSRPPSLRPSSLVPQEEMYSFVTLAEDQNTKKGVVVLEA